MTFTKFVLLGGSGVGKTALADAIKNTARSGFDCGSEKDFRPTVVAESTEIFAPPIIGDSHDKLLSIWDIPGSEQETSINNGVNRYCVSGSLAVLLVVDLTDEGSLNEAKKIYDLFLDDIPEGTPTVVLGNKSDCPERKISEDKLSAFAQFGIKRFNPDLVYVQEVSARTGMGVLDVISCMVGIVNQPKKKPEPEPEPQVAVSSNSSSSTLFSRLWALLASIFSCFTSCVSRQKEYDDGKNIGSQSRSFDSPVSDGSKGKGESSGYGEETGESSAVNPNPLVAAGYTTSGRGLLRNGNGTSRVVHVDDGNGGILPVQRESRVLKKR